MGQLFQGVPLSWEESQKYADYIREHGITQFLNVWKKEKNRQNDPFLWGDEVNLGLFWILHLLIRFTSSSVSLYHTTMRTGTLVYRFVSRRSWTQ